MVSIRKTVRLLALTATVGALGGCLFSSSKPSNPKGLAIGSAAFLSELLRTPLVSNNLQRVPVTSTDELFKVVAERAQVTREELEKRYPVVPREVAPLTYAYLDQLMARLYAVVLSDSLTPESARKLPVPMVVLIDTPVPNAFSLSLDNGPWAIFVNRGAFRTLTDGFTLAADDAGLAFVLGHEFIHMARKHGYELRASLSRPLIEQTVGQSVLEIRRRFEMAAFTDLQSAIMLGRIPGSGKRIPFSSIFVFAAAVEFASKPLHEPLLCNPRGAGDRITLAAQSYVTAREKLLTAQLSTDAEFADYLARAAAIEKAGARFMETLDGCVAPRVVDSLLSMINKDELFAAASIRLELNHAGVRNSALNTVLANLENVLIETEARLKRQIVEGDVRSPESEADILGSYMGYRAGFSPRYFVECPKSPPESWMTAYSGITGDLPGFGVTSSLYRGGKTYAFVVVGRDEHPADCYRDSTVSFETAALKKLEESHLMRGKSLPSTQGQLASSGKWLSGPEQMAGVRAELEAKFGK